MLELAVGESRGWLSGARACRPALNMVRRLANELGVSTNTIFGTARPRLVNQPPQPRLGKPVPQSVKRQRVDRRGAGAVAAVDRSLVVDTGVDVRCRSPGLCSSASKMRVVSPRAGWTMRN